MAEQNADMLIEAGAPGEEHERLKKEMERWAIKKGYDAKLKFNNGLKPDVLRGKDDKKFLFCGDAKDSAIETVDNADTVKRIESYIRKFALFLERETSIGGIIAITTNSLKEARRWVSILNLLSKSAGIIDNDSVDQRFSILCIGKNTYVIHCNINEI